MFVDLSWSHMLLVLVVALVVVGPRDLPKVMHTMGKWAGKARAMADQFRKSFDEMARQSELDELRKELDELRNARPFAETEKAMTEALQPPQMVSVDEHPREPAGPDRVVEPAHAVEPAHSAEPSHPVEPSPEPVEPAQPVGEGHTPPPP